MCTSRPSASWLDAAELEASMVSSECLGRRRISSLVDLISTVAAWRRRAEREHRVIDWRFRVDDARRVFRYDGSPRIGQGTTTPIGLKVPRDPITCGQGIDRSGADMILCRRER